MFIFPILSFVEMASMGLQGEDRLDGASNYCIWKAKMYFLLDEHGLKTCVERVFVPTNPQ